MSRIAGPYHIYRRPDTKRYQAYYLSSIRLTPRGMRQVGI